MTPDKVDQLAADQADPLVGVVEQLAHRQRRGRLPAQVGEVADVLGRERVLDEVRTVLLDHAPLTYLLPPPLVPPASPGRVLGEPPRADRAKAPRWPPRRHPSRWRPC